MDSSLPWSVYEEEKESKKERERMRNVEIIKISGFSRDCVSLTKRVVAAVPRAILIYERNSHRCLGRLVSLVRRIFLCCVIPRACTHARTKRECEDAGSHEFRYRGLVS